MIDNHKLLELYNELDLDQKRKEINLLIQKIENLSDSILSFEGINTNNDLKKCDIQNESKFLSSLYENLWDIKNKLIIMYSLLIQKEK